MLPRSELVISVPIETSAAAWRAEATSSGKMELKSVSAAFDLKPIEPLARDYTMGYP